MMFLLQAYDAAAPNGDGRAAGLGVRSFHVRSLRALAVRGPALVRRARRACEAKTSGRRRAPSAGGRFPLGRGILPRLARRTSMSCLSPPPAASARLNATGPATLRRQLVDARPRPADGSFGTEVRMAGQGCAARQAGMASVDSLHGTAARHTPGAGCIGRTAERSRSDRGSGRSQTKLELAACHWIDLCRQEKNQKKSGPEGPHKVDRRGREGRISREARWSSRFRPGAPASRAGAHNPARAPGRRRWHRPSGRTRARSWRHRRSWAACASG
jgi:hypothetical protein